MTTDRGKAKRPPSKAQTPPDATRIACVRLPRLLFRLNEHLPEEARLDATAMMTLLVLAQSTGPEGFARISMDRMAIRVGARREATREAMRTLANRGLIAIGPPSDGIATPTYDVSPTYKAIERIHARSTPMTLGELTAADPADEWVLVRRTANQSDAERPESPQAERRTPIAIAYFVGGKAKKERIAFTAASDAEAVGLAVTRHAAAFRARRGARPTITVTRDGALVATIAVRSRTTMAGTTTWSAQIDLDGNTD